MSHIYWEWSKWWQTMKVAWSELFVYRINFFLIIIGPMLVFLFVKYNLWTSIYEGHSSLEIKGYTLDNMLSYHMWYLIVSILSMAYNSSALSEDIRLGKISNHLIYPFSLWKYTASKFLSLQIIQLFIALFTFFILYLLLNNILKEIQIVNMILGILMSLLVSVFWFCMQYSFGLMAFWLDETWTFRVVFKIVSNFLSGAIIPLDLYPKWLVDLLGYTPFPYIAYVPIKIFSGDYQEPVKAFLFLIFWILVALLISKLLWHKGLKYYTAAGM